MIIDSSALLAILLNEPERTSFQRALKEDQTRLISTATLLEASVVVLGRRGEPGVAELHLLIADAEVETVAFTPEHLALALEAFRRFGKGRHPASLNFGDCFSYALAKATNEPLLFKGDDFSKTDIGRVI